MRLLTANEIPAFAVGVFRWLVQFILSPVGARITLALTAAFFAAVAIAVPAYNWDLLAYAAIAVEYQYANVGTLHAALFAELRSVVGDHGWETFTAWDAYRKAMHEDAQKFATQLGFYRVKIAYIWAIQILEPLSGVIRAPWIISFAFGMATLALFYRYLMRLDLETAFGVFIPVLLAANVQWLFRVATPDSMAAFFILLAAYLWAFQGRTWAYVVLAVAILVRPDTVLISIGLMIAMVVSRRVDIRDAIGLLVAALAVMTTAAFGDHVGWWGHFYHTNVSYQFDMTAFSEPFRLATYIGAVANGVVQAVYKESWFHMYLAILLIYAILRAYDESPIDDNDVWVIALLLALGGRIILFPFLSSRIMCPTVLITALVVAARLHAMPIKLNSVFATSRKS